MTVRVRTTGGDGVLDGEEVVFADGRRLGLDECEVLPPVDRPGKIIAIHLNFPSRVSEFGARMPAVPSYFMKPSTALSAHGRPVVRPAGCRYLNYEGEVALVIASLCRDVALADALAHVAGFMPGNDFGVHDFRTADRGSMLRVKGQDGFCPVGPGLVPATEVDPGNLTLRTYVNGKVVQEGNSKELAFPYAYLVADIARLITLEAGDVILTGTPANSRPVQPGDVVDVEIEGVGRLSNPIMEAPAPLSEIGAMPEDSQDARDTAFAIR